MNCIKYPILFLILISIIQVTYAENYTNGDWDTHKVYYDYIKSNLTEITNYVNWKVSDYEHLNVTNVTGYNGNDIYICLPNNLTKIFDCNWINKSNNSEFYVYEENIHRNNTFKCNWWCKIKTFWRKLL